MAIATPSFLQSVPPWAILCLGVVTGGLKTAWDFIYKHTIGYLINKISLSITVEDTVHQEAYLWLNTWAENRLRTRGISSLLLRRSAAWERGGLGHAVDNNEFSLIPYYGSYYLRWLRRFCVIDHWESEGSTSVQTSKKMHWIKIQVWFTRDRKIIQQILDEAKAEYLLTLPSRVDFFRYNAHDRHWQPIVITPRTIESTYYEPSMVVDLLRDMESFIASGATYHKLGIPYRRGYQLDGPPGTGKSTLILAVATKLNLPIYSINLQGEHMNGDVLNEALNECRKPAILVFEDIDCLKASKTRDSEATDTLTLSDLLNALDGLGASEGRMVFMTANHPENLDPALTRSGRIDRKFHVGYAADQELRRFYDNVKQHFPLSGWHDFRAALPEEATIADAQALAFRGSPA